MSSPPTEEHVWLGDLSGFEVTGYLESDRPVLYHRCGWSHRLAGAEAYLANVVEIALGHRGRTCRGDGF